MPRLPTAENFGPRPTPRSQRGVIPVRAGIAESAEARGLRQAARSAGEISNIALGFAEKFAREDAEREARDLDTQYSNAVRALQLGDGTDANPGFLNLQGQAAIDAREAHMRRLEKLQETMLEKASSDRVRSLVSGPFSSRLNSALNSSVVHFGRQRRVANDASFKSHQAAIADDAAVLGAAGDVVGVERLATLAGAQAAAHAEQTGADPAFEAEAAVSGILVSEIERRAVTDVDAAREFFEEHRDDIDGRQHTKIQVALDRAERQAVRDAEKAEKAAEKILKEAQDVRAAELTDDILEGRGEDAVLDAALANREIRGNQFIAARKLLKAQESPDAVEDDPGTVLALNVELDQGVLTVPAVRAAYADKLLTKATMDGFVGDIQRGPDDFRTKEQRRMLRENVGGVSGLGAILGEDATRRVNQATQEFNERTRGSNKEDPLAVRQDIESRAAEPRSLDTLFRPRFMIGPDKETMDVKETRKATAKALREGKITPAQAAREVRLIKDIEAARARQ